MPPRHLVSVSPVSLSMVKGQFLCWNAGEEKALWWYSWFIFTFGSCLLGQDFNSSPVFIDSLTLTVIWRNSIDRDASKAPFLDRGWRLRKIYSSALVPTVPPLGLKWLEATKRKRLEAHEVFSDDPALYRWQCWASTFKDPNSKDPTYVDEKVRVAKEATDAGNPVSSHVPQSGSSVFVSYLACRVLEFGRAFLIKCSTDMAMKHTSACMPKFHPVRDFCAARNSHQWIVPRATLATRRR